MGLFDSLRNQFKRQTPEPGLSAINAVRFSEWTFSDNDLVRQYDFYHTEDPDSHAMFQFRCTMEMGAIGFIQYYVHFILQPAIYGEAGNVLIRLCLADDEERVTRLFPVEVQLLDGNANLFWIGDKDFSEECLAMLCACRPMRLEIHDNDCVSKLPLENDDSFSTELEKAQQQVSGPKPFSVDDMMKRFQD